jgi:phage baseplate assembly protein W
VLSAYVVQAETIRAEAVAAAAYAALLSYAQRVLSTPVRAARRQDGTVRTELETALRLLTAGAVALGAALLLVHV